MYNRSLILTLFLFVVNCSCENIRFNLFMCKTVIFFPFRFDFISFSLIIKIVSVASALSTIYKKSYHNYVTMQNKRQKKVFNK